MGTSVRNFSLAFAGALLCHGILLLQKRSAQESEQQLEKSLTVAFLVEKRDDIQPEETPPPEQEPPVIKEPPKEEVLDSTQVDPRNSLIDESVRITGPTDELETNIQIQTTPQSLVFRNWLETETKNFARHNPEAVGHFDKTFYTPPPPIESDEFSVYNKENFPTQDSRGTGEFILEKDGKRTCGLKIDSLLSSDSKGANGSDYVYADCTPNKEFDLKLNQPNNGWTNR